MEQTLEQRSEAVPAAPLYTMNQVLLGGFLGTVFAAAYMLRKNYLAMGNTERATHTIYGAVLIWAVVTLALLGLPESVTEPISGTAIGAVYALLATVVYSAEQHEYTQDRFAAGVKRYSGWNVFVVILIGLIVALLSLVPAAAVAVMLGVL